MKTSSAHFACQALPVALLALVVGALYYPFLHNPPLFDDRTFFWGGHFSYYATHPFGLALRLPGYFSLAVTEVLIGGMYAHRIVSLAAHMACCVVLYFLLRAVLSTAHNPLDGGERSPAVLCAYTGATLFAIHPVAVYGAAYLVQRSIVVATLFSLLSMLLFLRGLTQRSYRGAVYAAAAYSLAVLSKEHAILVCVAVLLCIVLVRVSSDYVRWYAALYAALCVPAALFVVLLSKSVIAQAYEPDIGAIATQVESLFGHGVDLSWSLSALVQSGLFFKYLALWFLPDVDAMSIDVRVNFFAGGTMWRIASVLAFLTFGLFALWCLRRGGRWKVAGYGLLYTWTVFLVEFTASRFQEPFVLYRSYLWAPGLAITTAAILIRLPRPAVLAFLAAAGPILVFQSYDRLKTFSSPLLIWEDAAAKLPVHAVPWGSRTLYNLGREYLYTDQPEKALAVTERCLATYPETFHCYFARGAVHLQLGRPDQALSYLLHAMELEPQNGMVAHRVGLALERMGQIGKARDMYEYSAQLGYKGALHSIAHLDTPGAGLLVPDGSSTTQSTVMR